MQLLVNSRSTDGGSRDHERCTRVQDMASLRKFCLPFRSLSMPEPFDESGGLKCKDLKSMSASHTVMVSVLDLVRLVYCEIRLVGGNDCGGRQDHGDDDDDVSEEVSMKSSNSAPNPASLRTTIEDLETMILALACCT